MKPGAFSPGSFIIYIHLHHCEIFVENGIFFNDLLYIPLNNLIDFILGGKYGIKPD